MKSPIVIVRTGVANVASVRAVFERLGVGSVVSDDPGAVQRAERVVLPGVGAFGPAMAALEGAGLVAPLRARLRRGDATLAICLGMQLLFEESAESPGVRGLGAAAGRVERLPAGVRVPQMGWNRVSGAGTFGVEDGDAYFANSFAAFGAPAGWSCAWTDHGAPFVSAMRRGSVVACQFHPELSGAWGRRLVGAWLAMPARSAVREEAASC